MNIYTITEIAVDTYGPAMHTVDVFTSKDEADALFEKTCKNSNDYFKSNYEAKVSELNTEKREDFYHVNNDKDYITCIIEEKEVI